jgi:hypothetical protein
VHHLEQPLRVAAGWGVGRLARTLAERQPREQWVAPDDNPGFLKSLKPDDPRTA